MSTLSVFYNVYIFMRFPPYVVKIVNYLQIFPSYSIALSTDLPSA